MSPPTAFVPCRARISADCRRSRAVAGGRRAARRDASCRRLRRRRSRDLPRRWWSGCCRAARWRCTIPSKARCSSSRSTSTVCDTLIAPAQLAVRLGELDLAARLPSLRNVIGLWRAPEQVASSPAWPGEHAPLTDVYLFGEAGLFGARASGRRRAGADHAGTARCAARDPGLVDRWRNPADAKRNVGLRGPMVALRLTRPASAGRALLMAQPPRDFVDTDYAARLDRATGAICITAPPSGVMAVGGYRFLSQDLQEWAPPARTGRAADGITRPAERSPPRRTRVRQRPRPRGAHRARP